MKRRPSPQVPKAVGREPVEAHITEAAVAAQDHVAEVLKAGMIGMAHVGDLRLDNFGVFRSRVEEELVDLVRADVAEDAAVLVGVPEPLGAAGSAACVAMPLNDLMGRNVDGLNDFADGALLDEHAGINSGFHFKALAVHDAVDALGLGDGFAHFGKLLEGGDAGLVGEKSLPCFMARTPRGARSLAICELRTS
jgi:hypothetical protein